MKDPQFEKFEKFIKENFKSGECVQLTLLVKTDSISRLLEALKSSGVSMAVLPDKDAKTKSEFDFLAKSEGNSH